MQKADIKISASKPYLILCEGVDAYYFLMWLLDYLKQQENVFDNFWIYDFGGITQLKPYLRTIARVDGFKDTVKSICIIRDAETNADGASQSIQESLRDLGLAIPDKPCNWVEGSEKYPDISVGYVLFPAICENPVNGTLENLCLKILAGENAPKLLGHVTDMLKEYKENLPRIHKNYLHSYFSLTDHFVSLKVGEAAKSKAFDFERLEIVALKDFLKKVL